MSTQGILRAEPFYSLTGTLRRRGAGRRRRPGRAAAQVMAVFRNVATGPLYSLGYGNIAAALRRTG